MTHSLITGGAGFIGSHLAEQLLAAGHTVTVIDDLSTGAIENLDACRSNPKFHYYIDTIMHYSLMAELVDRADEIYHLAAAVGVRLILDKPIHTISTNIRGSEIALELAARKGRRIIIASTSEVYGKGAKIPFGEEDDLVLGATSRPRWSYACSKAIDEFLALAYYREHNLPVVVVRLFNTVGPRQTGRYGMVIPRFVQQALAGEPITVYGDGTQTRSFGHVLDVVNALRALMNEPAAAGRVFNVGNDQEITIADLARLIVKKAQSTSELRFIPFEEAYDENFEDLQRRVPDLSRIRALIDFTPQLGIEEIVEQVIAYQRGLNA